MAAAADPVPAASAPPRGAIPLLRIFDTHRAVEFYVGFLGFEVVWEHRYDDHAPLYAEVVRDEPRGAACGRTDDHGAPVGEDVVVDAAPAAAFEAFTADLGRWWDRRYAPPGTTGARFDQHEGGAVALVTGDDELVIGRVTSWQPPQRFSLDYWLAVDPAHPTVLEVAFAAEGDRTRVTLTHGGWTAGNVGERAKFSDWAVLLDAFAAYVGRR